MIGGPQVAAAEDQRLRLLAEGEALLRAGDALAAQDVFQRAAMQLHAPDTECSIVRAQMQAGLYRQALAFGAHAALAHRGFAGGTALYVWMLHVGGQSVVAARLLDDALQRLPGNALLRVTKDALSQPWPVPPTKLLEAPLRAAPYPHGDVGEGAWRVAGSATLMPDGVTALVPLATVRGHDQVRVRNGLGQTTGSQISELRMADGTARLRLDRPLPVPAGPQLSERSPFAGSPLAVIEFGADSMGDAVWPQLTQGFAGSTMVDRTRRLGVELATGPRGGPVFDRFGRLAGMALSGHDGHDRLLELDHSDAGAAALAGTGSPDPAPIDAIYERGLHLALQVLVCQT